MRDMVAQMLRRLYPDSASVDVADSIDAGVGLASQMGSNALVVLDLTLPGIAGLAALRAFRASVPWVRVLVFSASEEVHVIAEAKRMGAFGYVPKSFSADRFADAVRRVLKGDLAFPAGIERVRGAARLSATEIELLQALERGVKAGSRSELASALGVSERVVKRRLRTIYAKLGVTSRVEAVARAKQLGAFRSVA